MKLNNVLLIGCLVLSSSVVAQNAAAQSGTPSSKATAAINTGVSCTFSFASTLGDPPPQTCHDIFTGFPVFVTADNFATIMSSTIKVSNSQSLFVSPSLVTGLYTQTKTNTRTGTTSTAVGQGGVYLRAIVTNQSTGAKQIGYPVAACLPGILGCQQASNGDFGVTVDSRIQTLTQAISDCIVTIDGLTAGTCDFTSTIDLILSTTSAHTFNFIFPSVGVGVYTVEIQAAVNSGASVSGFGGTATGAAAYGLGSLTVESVRLVHDFVF
jgi:hypothetical protein